MWRQIYLYSGRVALEDLLNKIVSIFSLCVSGQFYLHASVHIFIYGKVLPLHFWLALKGDFATKKSYLPSSVLQKRMWLMPNSFVCIVKTSPTIPAYHHPLKRKGLIPYNCLCVNCDYRCYIERNEHMLFRAISFLFQGTPIL